MPKTFEIAFSINGVLQKAFTSSFNFAKLCMTGVNNESNFLRNEIVRLNKVFENNGIGAKAYGEHLHRLNLELQGVEKKQKRMQEQANLFKGAKQNFANGFQRTYGQILFAKEMSWPLIGAIKTAADFEESMSKVRSLTQANDEQFAELTKTARTLGATTKYSAMEAADAMSFLGMAGWKTKDIVAGMPGLLALAASSGQDLALCADIVSDQLTAFGMSANQAGKMADILTVTSTGANTNVALMGETLKYVGAAAGAAGYSFDDVALAMGVMANASTKGSMAGTALRSVMTRLINPPKEAAEALASLPNEFNKVDDKGKLKSLTTQLEELRNAAKSMSKDQLLTFSKQVAGAEASTGFASILTASDEAWNKLKNDLSKAEGASERTRKIMENNTKGAAKGYRSAMQELSISVGTTFLPATTELIKSMTSLTQSVGKFAGENPKLTGSIISLTGALGGLWIACSAINTIHQTGIMAMAAYKLATETHKGALVLNTAKTVLNTGAKIIATAATWALTGAIWAMNAAAKILGGSINLSTQLVGLMRTGFVKLFAVLMANPWIALATVAVGAAILIWKNWDTIKQWFITLWDNPKLALQQFVDGVKNLLGDAFKWIKEKWENIGKLLSVPIFGKVNIAAEGTKKANPDVAHNAAGGIYGKGTFLTTFAENSPEAAIPIDGSKRATDLWMQTGKLMGLLPKSAESPEVSNMIKNVSNSEVANLTRTINNSNVSNLTKSVTNIYNNNSSDPAVKMPDDLIRKTENITNHNRHGDYVTVNFSPNITVNGSADSNTADMIKQMLRQEEASFERRFKEMLNQQRRLSYA